MHGRTVGGAVVGEDPFDADAVAAIEVNGATEEADRGRGLLVGEDLGESEAAVVVDRDVDVFPAGDSAPPSVDPGLALTRAAAADPVANAANATELLHVDVDELTWA